MLVVAVMFVAVIATDTILWSQTWRWSSCSELMDHERAVRAQQADIEAAAANLQVLPLHALHVRLQASPLCQLYCNDVLLCHTLRRFD